MYEIKENEKFVSCMEVVQTELNSYDKKVFNNKKIFIPKDPTLYNYCIYTYFKDNFKRLNLKSIYWGFTNEEGNISVEEKIYNGSSDLVTLNSIDYKKDNEFEMCNFLDLLKIDIFVGEYSESLHDLFDGQLEWLVSTMEYEEKKFLILDQENSLFQINLFYGFVQRTCHFGYTNPSDFYNEIKSKSWFTNFEVNKSNPYLTLKKSYLQNKNKYKFFDDFNDILNIDFITDIPYDYEGIMGVPSNIMKNFNYDQFDLLGTDEMAEVGDYIENDCVEKLVDNDEIRTYVDGEIKPLRVFIRKKFSNIEKSNINNEDTDISVA